MSSQRKQSNGKDKSMVVRRGQPLVPKRSNHALERSIGRMERAALLAQEAVSEASITDIWAKFEVSRVFRDTDRLEEVNAAALASPERQAFWQGLTEGYMGQIEDVLDIFGLKLSAELKRAFERLDNDGRRELILKLIFGG